jgi:hypothetical protein
MFLLGTTGNPAGVVHTMICLTGPAGGHLTNDGQRRSAGLHADGLIKNIFSYAQ